MVGVAALIAWRWVGHVQKHNEAIQVETQPPEVLLVGADPAVARAVADARSTVAASPRSAAAWGELGMLLLANEIGLEQAPLCFAQAETLDPRDFRWPAYHALAVAGTDPDRAAIEGSKAADLADLPAQAHIRLRCAEILLAQGQIDSALLQAKRVRQLDPADARGALLLARAEIAAGNLASARDSLAPALSDPHTRRAAHLLLGQLFMRLGDPQKAAAETHIGATLPPDVSAPDPLQEALHALRTGRQVQLARAAALLSHGQAGEALSNVEQLLKDDPNSDWAWLLKGRAHLAKKNLSEAEHSLRRSTQLNPRSAEAYFYLGVCLFLENRVSDAAEAYRNACRAEPTMAVAYANLGDCLKQMGDRPGAISALEDAIARNPDVADTHAELADLYVEEGRADKAREQLQAAIRIEPGTVAFKKRLSNLPKPLDTRPTVEPTHRSDPPVH